MGGSTDQSKQKRVKAGYFTFLSRLALTLHNPPPMPPPPPPTPPPPPLPYSLLKFDLSCPLFLSIRTCLRKREGEREREREKGGGGRKIV